MWVLTIGVLEVNPEWESIRAQRERARFSIESFFNNWIVGVFWDLGASGVGSKVWVPTFMVLKANPERDSIRAQRGRARSALFSRVRI